MATNKTLQYLNSIEPEYYKPSVKEMKSLEWGNGLILTFRNKHYCSECGKEIDTEKSPKKCQHCKKVLNTLYTPNSNHFYSADLVVAQEIDGWLILRRFLIHKLMITGHKPSYEMYQEIGQHFFNGKNIYNRQTKIKPFPYQHYTPYIKGAGFIWRGGKEMYDERYYGLITKGEISPKYSKLVEILSYCTSSITYNVKKFSIPMFETLLSTPKAKWSGQISHDEMKIYQNQVRLLLKHNPNYNIEWSDYRDHIKICKELGLDINNPKILMPADFERTHQLLINRQERKRLKEKLEKQKADLVRKDITYQKNMSKYFHLFFQMENGFTISPIKSAQALFEEGEVMHHCVGGYWSYADSLIMSCRNESGKRVATIEFNLKKRDITQIRGVCNQRPKEYDLIFDFIMQNKSKIKKSTKKQSIKAA